MSDTITLRDGSLLTVDAVTSGNVTQFTVTTPSTANVFRTGTRDQVSTSGSGTNFILFPATNNVDDLTGGQIFSTSIQPFYATNDTTLGVWIDYQMIALNFLETLVAGRNYRFQAMYLQQRNNASNDLVHFVDNQVMTKLVLKR